MFSRTKLNRFIIITLIAVLSLGLSACQKENSNSSVTTTPTTVPPTTAAPDMFTRDDLMAIFDEAGEIFKTGSYVIEQPNAFISHFFQANYRLTRFVETTENSITISYEPNKVYESKAALQFGIFLDLICTRYPDAFCDTDYTYSFSTNRTNFGSIFFAPDYAAYGYSSPLDLYKAFEKNEAIAMGNCFEIYYNDFLWIKIWDNYKGQNTSYEIYNGD